MKYVVNWIPLRIRIRSRNYQPHLKNEKQLEQELELSFFDAGLAADKIGDSPTKLEMKLGPQTHSVPSPNLKGPHNWSQNCRKMAIIISRRRRGTWEGVLVANWCSKWICRMWGGLGPHILIIPASLSLSPMRGAAIGRTPTILQNNSFYTRISNSVKSLILSATRGNGVLFSGFYLTNKQTNKQTNFFFWGGLDLRPFSELVCCHDGCFIFP